MRTRVTLSAGEARRIAIAAQGLAEPPPEVVEARHVRRLIRRLGVVQIDSVNVLVRTHYLPLFSRLGAYDRTLLETEAWGRRKSLFEYWAHEASFVPIEQQPLFRWRMADAASGATGYVGLRRFAAERRPFLDAVLAEIERRGPLSAGELEIDHQKGEGGWWGWSDGKRALEWLFWAGLITTRTRRSFERVYDLTERVLSAAVRDAPTPPRDEAQRALLLIAARALGVATQRDLRDYFRMGVEETRERLAELVEAGALTPVSVKGWGQGAYLHPEARAPRRVERAALLSPFDNLIFFRERAERLFQVRIRLEIYTPADKRTHGYYVLPFLQGDRLTARVDLKADRAASALLVQAAHAETGADSETAPRLAAELARMARWLGLERIVVAGRGDLAPMLAGCLALEATIG